MQNILATRARDVRRQDQGFTLIELLIVVVILGVLAGIVVFSVKGINDDSKVSACKANVSTAQTAVEAYYAQKSAYPATLGALVPDYLKTDPSDSGVDAAIRVGYAAGTGTVSPGTSCD
ncbi:type II secretion system protein [Nocardioides sp. MH1]|uniref:type II secretion system protein n=1 Tax=Nocardioides sp. MH1 TaxID=3242490 RepID=UPI00352134F1